MYLFFLEVLASQRLILKTWNSKSKIADVNRELSSDMATVEAQIVSPNPKDNIVRASLGSIRRILEGAGGGAAAQLLLIQLQSLF